MRATAIPCLEWSLLDLGMGAPHIKVCGMLDGLRPELEVKASVLEERGRFAVNSLSKALCGTVHLRGIRLGWLPPDSPFKEYLLELVSDIFPSVIVAEALNDPAQVRPFVVLLEVDKTVRYIALGFDQVNYCELGVIARKGNQVPAPIIA
jgi:hypothetical protein